MNTDHVEYDQPLLVLIMLLFTYKIVT